MSKDDSNEKVHKLLKQAGHACFILITCNEATEDGKMQVDMTYEGDSHLAAYLIDNAQDFFAQENALKV